MAKFTQNSIFVTSGKPFAEIRQAAIDFLNRFQNAMPPTGGDQSSYGLNPDGTVHQNFFAIVQGIQLPPMPDGTAGEDTTMTDDGVMMIMPSDTTRMGDANIRGLSYFATVFSDKATEAFNTIPLGAGFLADFEEFANKSELATNKIDLTTAITSAIAAVELKAGPPGDTVPASEVAELVVADPGIQNNLAAEVAKSIATTLDVDEIRLQAVQATLDRVNAPQIFEEVTTRLFNEISSNSDDIISSANLTTFRSIIAQFHVQIAALEARIPAAEEE